MVMSVVQYAEAIASKFEHYSGTTSRTNLLEILTEVMRIEFDGGTSRLKVAERQRLEMAVWSQVCARLKITTCCIDEIAAMLARCSSKCSVSKCCGCFGAVAI